jgi:hypothetical protein
VENGKGGVVFSGLIGESAGFRRAVELENAANLLMIGSNLVHRA